MKRILRIAWLSLVSAVIVTALGTMTSVLFGFPVKALTTSMLLGMLAIMFVVCVLLYYAVSLVPRKYEPHKRYLYQLIIGKHNLGMYLTVLEEEEFREAVVEYMVQSGDELSTLKVVEFLKRKDTSIRPINYHVVGITPKIVT